MTQLVSTFSQELVDICSCYLSEKCYAGTIPEKVLKRVQKKFKISDQEQILSFFDYTSMSYGKSGFAITEKGLYWRMVIRCTFIPWVQFMQTNIQVKDGKITYEEIEYFYITEHPIPYGRLEEFMMRLKDCALKWLPQKPVNTNSSNASIDQIQSINELTLEQALVQVCWFYLRKKVYLHPISEDILEQINPRFGLSDKDTVIAYLDFTIFGKGREGVVLTTEGIHWRSVTKTFVSWLSIGNPEEITATEYYLYPFPGKELSIAGSPLTPKEWIELLRDIYELPQMATYREVVQDSIRDDENRSPIATLGIAIKQLMQSFRSPKVYTDVPTDLKERLCTQFRIPLDLSIWTYFDLSFTGSTKDGVLLTEHGIYWGGSKNLFIPWYRLLELEITMDQKNQAIFLGEKTHIYLSGSIQKGDWHQILTSIQNLPQVELLHKQYVRSRSTPTYSLEAENYDELFIEAISREITFFDKLVDYSFNAETEERIRLSYHIEDSEQIVAYHKGNTKSRGELGLVLTSRAIYIANPANSGLTSRVILSLAKLSESNLTVRNQSLYLEDDEIYRHGILDALLALIGDISLYVESLEVGNLPIKYPYDPAHALHWNLPVQSVEKERWIVVEQGMLHGIYYKTELQWAIETNQLNPTKTLFWKKGIPSWVEAKEAGFYEGI